MGIDYGLGRTNIDVETGIRYGIFHQEMLNEWLQSEATPVCRKCCPHCGDDLPEDWTPTKHPHHLPLWEPCPYCGEEIEEGEEYAEEPEFWGITQEDSGKWSAWFDDQWDAWFTRSEYVYRAPYASPCAPGAGYVRVLLGADEGDCYCYGPNPEELSTTDYATAPIVIAGKSFTLVSKGS